jgi:hypothetical protein
VRDAISYRRRGIAGGCFGGRSRGASLLRVLGQVVGV